MITIYNPQGEILTAVSASDDSYRYRRVMGEDTITLKISLPEYIEIPVGSYIYYPEALPSEGKDNPARNELNRYIILRPQNIIKNNTRNFDLTLIFEGLQASLSNYMFRDTNTNKIKFSLTARPKEHLKMLVDNLNEREGKDKWRADDRCVDAVEKVISYSANSCAEALKMMADAFGTEYSITGTTISLKKVEVKEIELPGGEIAELEPLDLSYGYGNGFKSGIKRDNSDQNPPVEVLYVQGGTKNIPPGYKSQELLLPKDKSYILELEDGNVEYVSDEHGYAIWRKRPDGKRPTGYEASLDCSHIYPKRVGEVTEWKVVNAENHFYNFVDGTIPDDLDYEALRLDGTTMTVIFQSGMLAGKEFEVSKYVKETKEFELVAQQIDNIMMPDDVFKAEPEDKYAVFNVSMPQQYVQDDNSKQGASWEMFGEAARYLNENEVPRFSFTGELDGIWASKHWDNVGGKIQLGAYVRFTDEQFQNDPQLIRIVGIKDYLNAPHSPQIELSNVTSGAGFANTINKLETTEVTINEAYNNSRYYAARGYREAKETAGMLEKSLLDFDKSINPVTLNTMQMIVGDESLQFIFVDKENNPATNPHIQFNKDTGILQAGGGTIQHKTLKMKENGNKTLSNAPGDYYYWTLPSFESSADLTSGDSVNEPPASYYLYAKCERNSDSGTYYLSREAIAMGPVKEGGKDTGKEYYYFLTGILNSESETGERSFVRMHGFTEILPGQVTTNVIMDEKQKIIIDLENATITAKDGGIIEGDIKFLSSSGNSVGIEQAITDAVNAIDVGGRNLIHGSEYLKFHINDVGTGISTLMEDEPEKYYRARPASGKQVSLYGAGHVMENEKEYIASVYVRQISGVDQQIDIYEHETSTDGLNSFTLKSGVWTRINTHPVKGKGINSCIILRLINANVILDYKKVQVESGNKVTDWKRAFEDYEAQSQTAQQAADEANSMLADIANDDKLTADEKQSTLLEWTIIQSEYPKNISQANDFYIDSAIYTKNYNSLKDYITPLLSNISVTSDINGSTFRTTFRNYYDARTDLLNAISTKAKQAADDAQAAYDNMIIGGENLIEESDIDQESNAYGFATRKIVVEAGKKYVFSAEAKVDSQAIATNKICKVFIYSEDWSWSHSLDFTKTGFETKSVAFTAPKSEELVINSYLYPNGGSRTGKAHVKWYQLQEGNKATAYQVAAKYITDVIKKGSTDIKGGLLATNLLQMKGLPVEMPDVADVSSIIIPAESSNDYNYRAIKGSTRGSDNPDILLKNGVKYKLTIGSAVKNTGTATNFSCMLYDFVNEKGTDAFNIQGNFSSSPQAWEFTVPNNGFWSIIVYAGLSGSTAGNACAYNGIKLQVAQADARINTGLSGLDDDNIAFWTGGDYAAALGNAVATLLRKDGSGFFARGLFNWDTTGSLNVGIFSVLDDRILIDNGEKKIIISNRTIGELESQNTTVNIPHDNEFYYISKKNQSYFWQDEIFKVEKNIEKGHYNVSGTFLADIYLEAYCAGSLRNGLNASYNGAIAFQIRQNGVILLEEILYTEGGSSSLDLEVEIDYANESGDQVEERKTVSCDVKDKYINVESGKIDIGFYACKDPGGLSMNGDYRWDDVYAKVELSLRILNFKAISLTEETIIGIDGISIRQNSDNYFKIKHENERISVAMKGLPTTTGDLETGDLYRQGNQLMIK